MSNNEIIDNWKKSEWLGKIPAICFCCNKKEARLETKIPWDKRYKSTIDVGALEKKHYNYPPPSTYRKHIWSTEGNIQTWCVITALGILEDKYSRSSWWNNTCYQDGLQYSTSICVIRPTSQPHASTHWTSLQLELNVSYYFPIIIRSKTDFLRFVSWNIPTRNNSFTHSLTLTFRRHITTE